MKKRKKILLLAALCLISAGGASGAAAYLSKSPEELLNVITAGSVEAVIKEEHWKPENGRKVYPGQTLPKDPVVENTGENGAFVFLEIGIPCENIAVVEEKTGKKTEKELRELFVFQADEEDWQPILQENREGDRCYVFGYRKVLQPGEKTPPLFEKVRAVNYLEGELPQDREYNIQVTAKAVQSNMDSRNLALIYREFEKQYEADKKGEGL